MSFTVKLACRIVALTLIVVGLIAGVLWRILEARAPQSKGAKILLKRNVFNSVDAVTWSPDGRTLVSGGKRNAVYLWDDSGELLRTLSGHVSSVYAVAFSPNGKILASSSDHTVKLWDSTNWRLLKTLDVNGYPTIHAISWSPDSNMLAAGGPEGAVTIWDARNWQVLRTLVDFGDGVGFVRSLAWNPDGETLASGTEGCKVEIWDALTGKIIRRLPQLSPVDSLAWSPDGRKLAIAAGDLKLWDGRKFRTLDDNAVHSVAWSPDNKTLANIRWDKLNLWDTDSGRLVRVLNRSVSDGLGDLYARSLAWTKDGKTMAVGNSNGVIELFSPNLDHDVVIWDQLSENEWISFRAKQLLYRSSQSGDHYVFVSFANQDRGFYPLYYYRNPLRTQNLKKFSAALPKINPKPIRYAWDSLQNKPLWLGGFSLVFIVGLTVTLTVARGFEPDQISRRFFLNAGYDQVDSAGDHLMILRRRGERAEVATAILFQTDRPLSLNSLAPTKTYVIYRDRPPSPERLQAFKLECNEEVIPLSYAILDRALSDDTCGETLRELEEPFIARTDPYDESRPISDPTWFFGRDDMLERLPAVLRHGQHVGLFGLRKVGKTSLIIQLRSRLLAAPIVWIDCQGLPANAVALFDEILRQLRRDFSARKQFARSKWSDPRGDFRSQMLHFYELWQAKDGQGPFVLILDEVDKLFPDRRLKGSDEILREWLKFSRVLRSLAQEKRCLVTLVTAYRPDVNSQNELSPEIGENPMFMSFQEYFLGALSKADTETMIREIGAWKDIRWSPAALAQVFELCGGHPLVTRFFASDACDQGDLKAVDLARVNSIAEKVRNEFHKHRIGQYFRESIWNLLHQDERSAFTALAYGHSIETLKDAVAHLEQFGLLRTENGTLRIAASLLSDWLERGKSAWAR